MPPPYETVVSIGGQSFVDGIWRLLGPALEGLTNPLPLALPGFTNAAMRITQLVPVFPGSPPATGALGVLATVELTAEALLKVKVSAGDLVVQLGPQALRLTDLAGTINLPAQGGNLTDINIGGDFPAPIGHVNLGPGSGRVSLPGGAARLTDGALTGTLNLPGELTLPGVQLPAVVPIAVDLTPSAPLLIGASIVLTVMGINRATRFGLLFGVGEVNVGQIRFDPALLAASLTPSLQAGLDRIVEPLSLPEPVRPPRLDATMVSGMLPLGEIPRLVAAAFDDALTRLLAETGRLVYPLAGAGASCDVKVLPTDGDGQLAIAADGTYVLQIGFNRGPPGGDIATFPPFEPIGIVDCNLLVGNTLLLELLCCLIERLPAFTLPVRATTGTTDIKGDPHVRCCTFTDATVNLGPAALGGTHDDGVSICIDGASGSPKTFALIGRFSARITTPVFPVTLVTANLEFKLPLSFDLDEAASLANLRVLGTTEVTASVRPNVVDSGALVSLLLLIVGALFGLIVMAAVGLGVATVVALLVYLACAVASFLLRNAVQTLLAAAALLRSPVAVPPGLFEAFGGFAPATVSVDDLVADGVLHTPTAPWGLLPRIGLGQPPPEPPTRSHL